MAGWIDSKRFAERWPFAGALVLIAAAALALLLLPSTVSLPAKLFSLFTLDSVWSAAFEKRLGGIGFWPNRWQRILLHQAVIVPCLGAFFYGGASGPFFAVGVFVALQIPLIVMKAKIADPKPPERPPSRGVRIAAASVFCLIAAALAVFSWKTHQPVWLSPSLAVTACCFGWSVYRLASQSRPQDAGIESENEAERAEEPASKEFDPVVKKSANVLLICLGLPFVDLLFREELYGFILPATWFVGSVLWLTFFHTRRGEGLGPLAGTTGESD